MTRNPMLVKMPINRWVIVTHLVVVLARVLKGVADSQLAPPSAPCSCVLVHTFWPANSLSVAFQLSVDVLWLLLALRPLRSRCLL